MSNTDTPVKVNTFSDGQTISAAPINQNFDDLFTGLANVGTANLLTDAITTAKVLDGQITLAKLAAAVQAALCPSGTVVAWAGITTPPTGWLFLNGLTIGDASSGATARANADTETLFLLIYGAFANAEAAVSGGRGASAAADYAAHKTIALPDLTGRTIAGKESAETRITTAVSGFSGATMGATGGSQSHTLASSEMPSHTHVQDSHGHPGSIADPHTHVQTQGAGASIATAGAGAVGGATANTSTANTNTLTIAGAVATNQNTGGGGAHRNVQPSIILNWIIKL